MAAVTQALADTSQHMFALNEGLRTLTLAEAQAHMTAMQTIIDQCQVKGLRRLEVELRLLQASFHQVVNSLSSASHENVKASIEKTLNLCTKFPKSAGVLMNTCKSAMLGLKGRQSPTNLYAKETRLFWKKWRDHELGHLKCCPLGHPYSSATFSDCPECGPEVAQIDYNSFLHEDAFVKRLLEMNKR